MNYKTKEDITLITICIAFIIITLLLLPRCGFSEEHGYKGAKWGMSKFEVWEIISQETMGSPFILFHSPKVRKNSIEITDYFEGEPAIITYFFVDDKLERIEIINIVDKEKIVLGRGKEL